MNHLLIFIKNPIKGKVKTRIAATTGDDKALKIYLELLRNTRKIATQINATQHLFYADFINNNDDWSDTIFNKQLQVNGDLGIKMATAFQTIFNQNATKCVLIGSDCASLTPDIINQAFTQLDECDFVVGPAIDGGYYLIGMQQYSPEIFDNIDWSTEKVLSQTVSIIEEHNKTFALLPTLSDIDYEEDWIKYGWKIN